MKLLASAVLSIFLCTANYGVASASESDQDITFGTLSRPLLFEVVENGVATGTFVAVSVWAVKSGNVRQAECMVTMFSKLLGNGVGLSMFEARTDEGSITDLFISKDKLSFQFAYATPDRPLTFVATIKDKAAGTLNAGAVGEWTSDINPSKLIKVEWRQVQTIKLSSSIIEQ